MEHLRPEFRPLSRRVAREPSRDDHRFAHESWKRYPFNLLAQSFLLTEDWWREATTGVRGVSRHNEAAVSFLARQLLDMGAPSNMPWLNPEVIETTIGEQGANLLRGAGSYVGDRRRLASGALRAARNRPAPKPSRSARMLRPPPARWSSATG